VGLGVRTAAIRKLHMQGSLSNTTNKLDLALRGRGWFQVAGADGEMLYTRAGAFNKSADGQIVTIDGYVVQPAIAIPDDATDIVVNESGEVFARIENEPELQLLGQLTLANFANEAGLEPIGGNLYRETEASGGPVVGVPRGVGFARVRQGLRATSNCVPVEQIT